MSDAYPKPFVYEIQAATFDIHHQLGVAVALLAQMPNKDVRRFRHAERLLRPDGPGALIDPQAIADAVKACVEHVNQKYREAAAKGDTK